MTSAWPQSNETKQPFLIVDTAKIEPSSYVDQSLKFIVTAPETSGTMTVFESTEHPGYKTQWHRHNNAEETFYILEGVLTVKAAGKTHHARAGSFVYIPRGTPHGQGNFSDKPVRFITTVTPAGIELFFRDRDEILKTTKPADPAFASRLQAVREKHKHWLEVLGPWEPDSKP
jgi:quercetin dioxygenase-like cupin family protein